MPGGQRRGRPRPAPGVVAVGATNDDLELAGYSTRNQHIDLMAPGDDTLSTTPDGGYEDFGGTSAAAPHVAAAAAVARASNPDASAHDVADALVDTADLDRLDISGEEEEEEEELGAGQGFLDIPGTIEQLRGVSSGPLQTPLADRSQAAYVQHGTLYAFDDGVARPVRRVGSGTTLWLDWSADHERLIGSDGESVFLWSATDRTLVEQRCESCWGAAYVDSGFALGFMDRVVTTTYEGRLRTFDVDLDPRDDIPLSTRAESFTYYTVVGDLGGQVLLERSAGPETTLWLVDPHTGRPTATADPAWGSLYPLAIDADGSQIAYAAVPPNAGCFDVSKVHVLDDQLRPVATPAVPATLPTGGTVAVHDLFFNGDALYAVMSTSRDSPATASCVQTREPTLWRLGSDGQWEQVHRLPVDKVRPLEGMSEAMTGQLAIRVDGHGVFVPHGATADRSGDPTSDLGEMERRLWSTPTTDKVDLRVPGPVSCPDISYRPNTDWGEFEITALGVSCDQATVVIRAVNDEGPGWSEPGRYTTSDGFACSRTVNRLGLRSADHTCVRGLARITWVSS